MKTNPASMPATIDEYLTGFPPEIRDLLQKVRAAIRRSVPLAEETISYRMPAFQLAGSKLVYFAAFKQHIGFYPTASGTRRFAKELARYEGAKGSVRFPFDSPIPYALIGRIAKFRAQEARAKAASKRSR